MDNEHLIDTQKTWDSIAKSFDKTRNKPWKQKFPRNIPITLKNP